MNQLGPELLVNAQRFTHLEDYEAFVQQDWLYPVGTDEAQHHVRGKLAEEAREAAEAVTTHDPQRIVDELGDFLWTADANALNVGISLQESLRHELRPDQIGGGFIGTDRIDMLALELIPDEPIVIMAGWITYLGHYLGKAAKQWRNLSPLLEVGPPDPWIELKRLRAYDGLTQALLVTSAVAQRHAGSTLADVMHSNAAKLNERKKTTEPITTPAK